MRKMNIILTILVSSLLLSACNFPLFGGSQEDEINALATAVAMTVQAMDNKPLPGDSQDQQPTSPPGLPTVTQQPTNTVNTPPTSTPKPCDKASFVAETIPDNTVFAPGESFTKSWTLKNIGTCTWNTDYKLKFTGGDAMDGPASVSLTKNVAPNEEVKLKVDLKAPASAGTYEGVWNVANTDGDLFARVTVVIKVESEPLAVTSVSTNLVNISPGACSYTMPLKIYVTSSAAGKVTYKTKRSDTGEGPTKSIKFDAAGTKTLESDWDITASGTHTYSLEVYIDDPNHQWFGPYSFKATCP